MFNPRIKAHKIVMEKSETAPLPITKHGALFKSKQTMFKKDFLSASIAVNAWKYVQLVSSLQLRIYIRTFAYCPFCAQDKNFLKKIIR